MFRYCSPVLAASVERQQLVQQGTYFKVNQYNYPVKDRAVLFGGGGHLYYSVLLYTSAKVRKYFILLGQYFAVYHMRLFVH